MNEECKLLKSLLYCTVRSCNNCGKVNCENFQKQRIDCCGLWVSYIDYIAKLEKENAGLHDNYEQFKAVAEPEMTALKNEIVNLKGVIESLSEQRDGFEKEKCELLGIIQSKDKAIADLKKENAELKEQNANLIAMLKSEREVRVNDDYLKGICEKESEIGKLEGKVQDWTSEYYELENFMNNKVAKAKEIIKDLLGLKSSISSAKEAERRFVIREKAEKFLEEKKGD